jgi:hypothetical protein
MNTVITILFSVLLTTMCICAGCFAVQCVEELRERWAKKRQAKSNSKDNGQ